MEKRHSPN